MSHVLDYHKDVNACGGVDIQLHARFLLIGKENWKYFVKLSPLKHTGYYFNI
jgi:hypothetical protein